MVTYVSFVLFTVLTGMLTAIIAMIAKDKLDITIEWSLYVSLFLIVVGVNLINLSVLKFIASFKREIVLAYRQLNCTRQSIASIIFSKLEGKMPNIDLVDDNGKLESKNNNDLYWKIYGQHLKYPINNANLRSIYLRTDSNNNESYEMKALYRSSDLLTLSVILCNCSN